jgi:hypothetical protein
MFLSQSDSIMFRSSILLSHIPSYIPIVSRMCPE